MDKIGERMLFINVQMYAHIDAFRSGRLIAGHNRTLRYRTGRNTGELTDGQSYIPPFNHFDIAKHKLSNTAGDACS